MKAIVKYQEGEGFIDLREMPEPDPGEGEVKIEVAAAGICGSDLHIWKNDIEIPVRPPVTLGHEFAGTIAAVGAGVEGFRNVERHMNPPAGIRGREAAVGGQLKIKG